MMHNSHTRFFILLGWCCLLTVAVLIMAVLLITGTNTQRPESGMVNRQIGSREDVQGSSPSIPNHIHLVNRANNSWTESHSCFCNNTSLRLKDNRTVMISVRGFYYAHAQVTFRATKEPNKEGTVTLIANENVTDRSPRKLSEAVQNGSGSVFMSNVILLDEGESVRLNISNGSMTLLNDESQTYWGLFLLARHETTE